MNKKIVKGKSLQEVQPNTKYMGCSFYLDYVDGENLEGAEFDNCSFRGFFRDWGRDEYGLWMAITYKDVRQVMRWIRPGTFMMGSPETEEGRSRDEVQHEVTLNEGFWLAETACTQELWKAVMGETPSELPSVLEGDKLPVVCVNWNDCQEFMDKWNEIAGGQLCFPTEAQWEYACRAGTTTAFSFGETITAEQVNSSDRTVEVKSLPCNAWGLYEMHGNVHEWCDRWDGVYSDLAADFIMSTSGTRIVRGGFSPEDVRSAFRDAYYFEGRIGYIGFRFCLRSQE